MNYGEEKGMSKEEAETIGVEGFDEDEEDSWIEDIIGTEDSDMDVDDLVHVGEFEPEIPGNLTDRPPKSREQKQTNN